MVAIQINQYGDNSMLQMQDVPVPMPAPNQVLVEIKAAAVNPVDYKIRSGYMSGHLPKTFPFTLGWEGAGIVSAVGENVQQFKAGDEVMLMPNFLQGGTYATFVAVNETEMMLKPQTISFATAAVIPFSLGTAYTALIEDADIKSGQRLLIHGAGGAVGQMAVQIAKHYGLYVIGTATGNNLEELKALGIDEVIDYATTDFAAVANQLDVVLDLVGGATLAQSYALLKEGGVIVSTTQPPAIEELQKHKINGKMTRTQFEPKKFQEVLEWVETGKIKVKSPQVLPLSQAQQALATVESRKANSKIVLAP